MKSYKWIPAFAGMTIALGAILRFTNLNWDSFLAFHPDERNIAWAVTRIRWFDELNPKFFAYGGLPIYLYRVLAEAVVFITKDPSWLNEWGKIVVIGRHVSATLSSISLLLIYLVGKTYFSKATGLLAAFLLAFSPWAIREAHFATTETMLVFFLLLLLLNARVTRTRSHPEGAARQTFSKHRHGLGKKDFLNTMKVWTLAMQKPRYAERSAAISGFILGLAIAAKPTSALFSVIPLAAIWLPNLDKLYPKLRATLVVFLVAAGTFLLFSPYTVIDRVHFLESMQYETGVVIGKFTVPYTLQFLDTTPYLYQLQTMLWQAGVVPILGLVGLGLFVIPGLTRNPFFLKPGSRLRGRDDTKKRVILFVFPLVYFAWSGSWFAKFSRYNVLTLPFFTIAAAWLLVFVFQKIPNRSVYWIIGLFVYLIIGLFQAAWGLANWNIYLRPQTRIEASAWMYQHIPANSKIYTEHWNDGLPVTVEGTQAVSFRRQLVNSYDEPDNLIKLDYWATTLAAGDYMIFTTPRILRTMPTLKHKYPVTSRVYQLLTNGGLGYQEVAVFTSYPELFGVAVNDDTAEETIQVFDHPPVRIFQNMEKRSKEALYQRILSSMGSMP